MKKIALLLVIILCSVWSGLAQTPSTSFETDFSAGMPTGNWYDWSNNMTFSFENEQMDVVIDRPLVNNWDRFILWVKPFDIGSTPYFSMRVKSDMAMPLNVTFKDTSDVSLDYIIELSGGNQWDDVLISLGADLEDLNYPILAEIQFDPNPGTALQATISIDDVKIGDAAEPDLSPPTIQSISNLLLGISAGEQVINMEGITDGGDGGQSISITAESDNPALIPDVSVDYTSPETNGTLSFTPVPGLKGDAVITLTLTDDGILENTTIETFRVSVMEYGGTGFTEDFESAGIDPLWDLTNADYTLTQSGGVLLVEASKNAGWESFSRKLDGFYDLSASPFVNLDVKSSKPLYLHVYLKDVNDQTEMREIRVMGSENFITASFDFSDASAINLDQVTGMIFAFNGTALTFDGNVWFDNLELGSGAERMAYLASVPDQAWYAGSGNPSILITDIANASALKVSSLHGLMENASFSPIDEGMSTLDFTMADDASGKDTLTITALGNDGFSDYEHMFVLAVEENMPPSADQLEDIIGKVGEELTIRLSGINDGNPSDEQAVSITALASDAGIIPDPVAVEYKGGPYAELTFTPVLPGKVQITISLTDDGGGEQDSSALSFEAEVFASLNFPPEIDPVEKQNIFNNAGELNLELTGISDGDGGGQNLSISAVSSVDSIVPNPLAISYAGAETALLTYTPNASYTGITTITLKVVDDGGTADNNGNDSTIITFEIESRIPPLTGWVVPLGEGDLHDYFSAEGEGVSWFMSYVDSGDYKALKLDMVNKWDYGGIWMDMPFELDLTEYPHISYEVYAVGSTLSKSVGGVTEPITDTYHWNYFYDVNGERNMLNSGAHMLPVEPDQWITVSYDYSDPGDMLTAEGEEILNGRISDVLFNLHWREGAWPFTDMSGTVYYRNIRIGDQAIVPVKSVVTSIDEVSAQSVFQNSGEHMITLTGISNGLGSTEGVSITASSGRSSIIPDPLVGELLEDGSATLTFLAGDKNGVSPFTVIVKAEGSEDKNITFNVNVISQEVSKAAIVTIDRSSRYQTIEGLGTFENSKRWVDMYAGDLGASAVRIGLIGNQIEPVNDNQDPYTLDMKALNYEAIDFEYFRMLKEAGVETFILTSWSPPAWMKTNLSLDWLVPNAEGSSEQALNRLEFHLYEEFAESMVAVVRMFREEAGIELRAIGLQNEPSFDEPYASAILDPTHFAELIEVVGKRFEAEGINTGFFMAEQVVGQNLNSNDMYFEAMQNNEEANPYCDVFAVHGYGEDGITPGIPSYDEWVHYFEKAQEEPYPKDLWMSETFIGYKDWSSAMSTAGAMHGALWAGNISLWTNWSFDGMQLTKNEPNSTYYTSKNYFKYIRPGAVRVETSTDHPDILATAFEHAEQGTFTVVLINKGKYPISVELAANNLPNGFKMFRTSEYENFMEADSVKGEIFILPANSVTTLYATEIPALTMDDVDNLYLKQDDPGQNIQLTGISDGNGGIGLLSLLTEASNPDLITDLAVTGIQADGTAELSFTPGSGLSGTALITLTLTDGEEKKEVKFYVSIESITGIRDLEILSLKVYPNPASDKLHIEIPDTGLEELEVTDMMGRVMLRRAPVAENLVTLNLESLESGIYILTARNSRQQFCETFIVE